MKKVLLCLCLLFLISKLEGQTAKLEQLKEDPAFLTSISELLNPTDSSATSEKEIMNVFEENWTTRSFNAFKDVTLQYPFKISFTDSTFASPVKRKKVVTSRYGWRWGRPHRGIDIDLITGDKVMAMFDGKVRYVRYVHGHGQTVVVRHDNGLETIYSHLSKQLVKPNQLVKKGDVIGKGGRTGNTRGSHLHLTISYKGVFINPEYFFDFGEENKVRAKDFWVTRKWTTPYLHRSRRQSNIEIASTFEEAKEFEANQPKVYVVQRGDTLSKISHKYNISIKSLCRSNSIRRNSLLKIGQKLIVSP